jgi:hypothetical protein
MEERLRLREFGPQLWGRDTGRRVRARLVGLLETMRAGDVLVVDATDVDAFDFSFAAELFGKTLSTLAAEFPGRFVLVENPNDCTGENLGEALGSSNLVMIQRRHGEVSLLGKVHPADQQTFAEIIRTHDAVSAGTLSRRLEVNLTAMNERLSKLTNLGVVRREKTSSTAGREQYVYRSLT